MHLAPPSVYDHTGQSDVRAQVLQEAGKKDWQGTLRWLRENPDKVEHFSYSGLQEAITARLTADPAALLRDLQDAALAPLLLPLGESLRRRAYAKRDAVWEWLDQQPPSAFTSSLRTSLLNTVAAAEPIVALRYFEKLPDTPENSRIMESGLRSLIGLDIPMTRFEELLDSASPKLRPLLLAAAFEFPRQHIIAADPQRWLPLFAELAPDQRLASVSWLAGSWATADPRAAVQWALSLPDAAQRQKALSGAAGGWAAHEPHAVTQWVKSLPSGKDRDIASRSVSGSYLHSEPVAAWTWARAIEAPEERIQALREVHGELTRKDRAIAQQLLQNLPPAERHAVADTRSK
jgi:hypothetical protein